ncbi:hypothetical protein [Raoultella ornithinolytica]|uniref:hypothetical protein n=1 Tax=Raoultella ornithinolytica TaxID=54291 RepID=UPI0022A879F1|nr:hypothetical protein [Raoultella ornithinolytica]MCZ0885567.1 hypothetical protein [Raoultella ornithinolytica]
MEFINKNASAIAALIGAFVAGMFGLINNFQNNRVNRDSRENAFKVEKWKANRALFIEKGEEAMTMVSSLSRYYQSFCTTSATAVLSDQNRMLSEDVRNILIDKPGNDTAYRLDTLITAYFPNLIHQKDLLVNAFTMASRKYMEYLMSKSSQVETVTFLVESGESIKNITRDMNTKLSLEIAKHI